MTPAARSSIALLCLSLLITVQRVRLYPAPLHGDICAYALIGHEMLHGRQLYSDLWERKPPLLYATFAGFEVITGYGKPQIFTVGLVTSLASLILLFAVGRSGGHGLTGGLIAGGFWVLMNCDLDLAANQPDPEVFINVWLTAAVLLLLRWPTKRQVLAAIVLGVLLTAATLYKHNTAIAVVALAVGYWLIPMPDRSAKIPPARSRFAIAAIAGLVVLISWAGMFGYFCVTGRRAIFVDVLFHQNASYSGDVAKNLGQSIGLHRLFPPFMIWMLGPAFLIVVAMLFRWRSRVWALPPRAWLLLAWAIGVAPTIALTGHIYPHYYQLWLPIGCIAAGWAGASLLCAQNKVPSMFSWSALLVVGIALAGRQGQEFLLTPTQWVHQQFPYFDLAEQNNFGIALGNVLVPDETFWELGEDNALYFFARRDPPSGLLFIDPLIAGDERDVYWRRLHNDLARSQPALVVMSDNWTFLFPPDAPVFGWIQRDYKRWPTMLGAPHYQLFVRKGSALAARVMAR